MLKKWSKKLVSLLTIAAFLLTLVPTAAFAEGEPSIAFDQETVPWGVNVPVKVKVNNLQAGDVIDILCGLGEGLTRLDRHIVQDDEIGGEKTITLVVPKIPRHAKALYVDLIRDGKVKADATIDKQGADGKDKVGIHPLDNPQDFTNTASYAYFKDGDKKDGIDTNINQTEEFKVEFSDKEGRPAVYRGDVYVWAEVAENQPDSRFRIDWVVDALSAEPNDEKTVSDNVWKIKNIITDDQGEGLKLEVLFTGNDKYRVYVSTKDPRGEGNSNLKADGSFKSSPAHFYAEGNTNIANVGSQDMDVRYIGIKSLNSPYIGEEWCEDGETAWTIHRKNGAGKCCDGNEYDYDDRDIAVYVDPNNTTKSKLEAYIYGIPFGSSENPLADQKVTFSTSSKAIEVHPESDTTDRKGKVAFSVTGSMQGEYLVYVEAGGVVVKVPVVVRPLRADSIEKKNEPTHPWAADDWLPYDALTFNIRDINGNTVAEPFGADSSIIGMDGIRSQLKLIPNLPGSLPSYLHGPVYAVAYEGDFVRINKKPAKSKLKATDCYFASRGNDDQYALWFFEKLEAGEYEIELRLDNGRSIVFNFEVQEFGTAKELQISYPVNVVEIGGTSSWLKTEFVDEKGVHKDARDKVTLGVNGYAVEDFDRVWGYVAVKNDEKYLGDTITVTAVAEKEGLTADTELVVTDGKGGDNTLTFDKKSGPVGKVNRVTMQVVDQNGKPMATGFMAVTDVSAAVTGQSNKDAAVKASVDQSKLYDSFWRKGEIDLLLESDQPTSADIKVTLMVAPEKKGAIHTTFYRGTLHYVFSDKAESAGRVVVMTIDSNQVIVDNNIVTIDTAALIKNDRTFVPFRALAEAFDAEVDYKDGVVTANLEGKTVEMTVDKTEYSVNGEEATMDVAPFIQDDRTMIPVRFAAEALGFQVTPTYNDDGTTASVAFQK